jgi:hypothetical protein
MAKKAKKKKPMHRGRKRLRHVEVPPAPPPDHAPPARRLTLDSVIYDLTTLKNTIADLL